MGVTGGRGTAGAGPGRDLLYGSREVPAPYRRTGDLALMSPAQGRPGCRSWSPSSRRRTGKPEKSEDAQNGEPLQDMG